MATHVKLLGILHLVFGCIGIAIGLAVLVFFSGLAAVVGFQDGNPERMVGMTVLGAIGGFVFLVLLVLSIPGLIAGFGLLNYRPWARVLGIVISALELMNVPFGTLLGAYGIWVLTQPETERLLGAPAVAAR